jgi:hypothetical protein
MSTIEEGSCELHPHFVISTIEEGSCELQPHFVGVIIEHGFVAMPIEQGPMNCTHILSKDH